MKEEKLGKILYEIFGFSVSIVYEIRQRGEGLLIFFFYTRPLFKFFYHLKNYNFKNKLLQLSYKLLYIKTYTPVLYIFYIYFTLEFLYNFMF